MCDYAKSAVVLYIELKMCIICMMHILQSKQRIELDNTTFHW